MDFEELFRTTVARWIEQQLPHVLQPVEVYRVEDNIREFAGCETCGPAYDVSVSIRYSEAGSELRRSYEYQGSLVDLIKELGSV